MENKLNKNSLRYRVYNHVLITPNGIRVDRFLIVLMYNKQIIEWTNYHKYIDINKSKNAVLITSTNKNKTFAVAKFLNFVFFESYSIRSLNELTQKMVDDFLNCYGMCTLPDDGKCKNRSKNTVETFSIYIKEFLLEYIRLNKNAILKESDLIKKVKIINTRSKKIQEKTILAFPVNCIGGEYEAFRDIPDKAFLIIMTCIRNNYKEILMPASESAHFGLRGAETLNTRRVDSKLGPGIIFETYDDEICDVFIDLRHEYNLRSDKKCVGKIKRHRMQQIYRPFIEQFIEDYKTYMKYIEGRKYESDYGPLIINKQGKAMTYATYYQTFKKAVKECIPQMLSSDDPELVLYGKKLLDGASISPHILRHWFTVQLVLDGCTVSDLQMYRGDKTPEASLTYLRNKGDLMRRYKHIINKTFDTLNDLASKERK